MVFDVPAVREEQPSHIYQVYEALHQFSLTAETQNHTTMDRSTKILFHNARIWTGEAAATWMTIDTASGFILETGTSNPPLSKYPKHQQKDARQKQIFPGFQDSHLHVFEYGKTLHFLDLLGCKSIEELQHRIQVFLEKDNDTGWLLGNSWDHKLMERYPDRFDIDKVCSTRPIYLRRRCWHIAVLNSKALEVLGITRDTPSPENGEIEKYPEGHARHGEPTGIVKEGAMWETIKIIKFSSDVKKKCLKSAMKNLIKNGVTSVHALEDETWNELCQLADHGQLPLRIFYSAQWDERHGENFPPYAGAKHGNYLSCDRVKIFADGALGTATAATSLPYIGSCNCGILIHPQEELNEMVQEATQKGYRLEIHCIGDATAETILNSFDKVPVGREKRPIMTHCQVLREDLLPRMRDRGVIANIQPQFVTTDSLYVEKILPASLLKYSYAWKTIMDAGILCAGSSDAPVEEPKPLLGMYDAIFRPVGKRDHVNLVQFMPEQCLTFKEALDLYTTAGAYTAMREHDLGKLLPGYKADFVILDSPRDLHKHPEDLLETKVEEVWVDGQERLGMMDDQND